MAMAMEIDTDSAALIMQLQLEDLEGLMGRRGKRSMSNALHDQDYALELFAEELRASQVILEDQIMCRSIMTAMDVDYAALAPEIQAENEARADRDMARRVEGEDDNGAAGAAMVAAAEAAGINVDVGADAPGYVEYMAKLTARFMSEEEGTRLLIAAGLAPPLNDSMDDDDDSDNALVLRNRHIPKAESSRSGGRNANGGQRTMLIERRCEACREHMKFYDLATVPHCRHDYCRECLDQLIRHSITDESLFPPRCCKQPIPLDNAAVRLFVSNETYTVFEAKRPELSTPSRTYCHRTQCARWVPPAMIRGDVATCPGCANGTCAICKQASHNGQDCPQDEDVQLLLRAADQRGWQRCPQCRRVIELDTGCNHITCRCRSQFCYICASPWKSCPCPQWDEDNLVGRANQIVERRRQLPLAAQRLPPPIPQPPPAPARAPVPELAPALARGLAPREEQRVANFFNAAIGRGAFYDWDNDDGDGPDNVNYDNEDENDGTNYDDEHEDPPPPAYHPPAAIAHTGPMQFMDDRWDVQAVAEHLREHHECAHGSWRHLREPDDCEECGDHMRLYIFECRQCAVRVCQRCRRNRL